MTENELRTKSDQYNQITHNMQFLHELYNATFNHRIIMDGMKDGRVKDLSEEPKREGEKCIIVGSGPSLDETLPYLKEWKGSVICTTSHASTLIYHGCVPDYILALDPFSHWDWIDGIDWSKYKTKLILTPTVWHELVSKWPNEMLLYRQDQAGKEQFYIRELSVMYSDREHIEGRAERDFKFVPHIRTQLTLFSCSPPAQLYAADMLKYETVFLCGVDFAYNKEKTRFTAWHKTSGEWVKSESLYKPPEKEYSEPTSNADSKEIETNNGLLSTPQMLFYKKNMFSAMRLSMQNCYVCGEGAITEIPQISPADMIRKQEYKFKHMKPSKLKVILEKYLAGVGGFVIVSEVDGKEAFTFIESDNPDFEIPDYIGKMNIVYNCPECGAELVNNDYQTAVDLIKELEKVDREGQPTQEARQKVVDETRRRVDNIKDHTGNKCIQCGKESLKKKFTADMHKNMKRIARYLPWLTWS